METIKERCGYGRGQARLPGHEQSGDPTNVSPLQTGMEYSLLDRRIGHGERPPTREIAGFHSKCQRSTNQLFPWWSSVTSTSTNSGRVLSVGIH